jgi:hypothetical protein
MTHLLILASALFLLPRLPVCAQAPAPPAPLDLKALGVPMDQLPQAEALLGEELAKFQQAGGDLTLEELAPPPVPDAENAALVYLEAFDVLKPAPPEPPVAPPPPEQTGAGGPPPPAETGTARAPTDEELYVADNAAALALLDKAAAMPRCRWPQDWTLGPAMVFPHYAKLRTCAQLRAAQMRVAVRAGHPDEVLRLCATSLALPRSLKDEPTLIACLVSYALTAISLDGLRNSLGLERLTVTGLSSPAVMNPALPTTPACRDLYSQLAAVDVAVPFRRAMLGELSMQLSFYQSVRDGLRERRGEWAPDPGNADEKWAQLWATEQGRQVLALDEIALIRSMTDGRAQLPWREQARTPAPALPAYCKLSSATVPIFARSPQKRDQALADLARAQIGLALVAYHNETGQWPESLAQVRLTVKWDLPLDPSSGNDFVYRREGAGWVLYSIGPDLKDNGGTAQDLVWRRK